MFKESFKYYKSKWPVPDFKDVIDFQNDSQNSKVKSTIFNYNIKTIYIIYIPDK